jgi:hypothetical protein
MTEPSEDLALWCARSLDARLANKPLVVPAAVASGCQSWMKEFVPRDLPPAIGLSGVPSSWLDTLAWAGVPLSEHGPLRWGVDVEQEDVKIPEVRGNRLLLPPAEELSELTSLSLKPMRMFISARLGCRLQAAPGIRLWLWPERALLRSLAPIPLSGFVYGPAKGHRAGVSMPPWGTQAVSW